MKIVLTGGGSGGHFYPLMAVAERLRAIAREEHLLEPDLYYLAPEEYDKDMLFEQDITYQHVNAGKIREYSSIKNFFDFFKTAIGIIKALIKLFFIFPDVVFSKGGYASGPVLFAARILGIPVIIHESDSVPSKGGAWASKFAKRIAISYPEAADAFGKLAAKAGGKIALTGNPVRKDLLTPASEGAKEFLDLNEDLPVILVLGGSQGAQRINETLIEALPELLEKYYVIHQTGKALYDITKNTADIILSGNQHTNRYKPFAYLDLLAMRMAAGAASLVISRAGSNAIFEIAAWGKPSFIIPIPEDVSRDQRSNAFAYARTGAALVIEQANLTPHLIVSEIDRLMENPAEREKMSVAAKAFSRPDAADKIAREVIELALEHEQ
ncbi:MAG: undecaprenyldiphospho-muramoylpentapeptide beta-N-acetylglucosaminyltransferase [Candidatus Pacebacteria bacterium]|nr:undecaprenyldiphospho-muramoylpentapeptide beta-N-acetylglucosaminyltransferase [Candidatus Paceibacterota bacterium]